MIVTKFSSNSAQAEVYIINHQIHLGFNLNYCFIYRSCNHSSITCLQNTIWDVIHGREREKLSPWKNPGPAGNRTQDLLIISQALKTAMCVKEWHSLYYLNFSEMKGKISSFTLASITGIQRYTYPLERTLTRQGHNEVSIQKMKVKYQQSKFITRVNRITVHSHKIKIVEPWQHEMQVLWYVSKWYVSA